MKKSIVIFATAIVMASTMLFVWQFRNDSAEAAKSEAFTLKGLTAEEISIILKSEALVDRRSIEQFVENADKRRAFLDGMREYLALAAVARTENLDRDENFKLNSEYKQNILLADLYQAKLSRQSTKTYVVPDEEVSSVWANAENEARFLKDMNALAEIRKDAAEAAEIQTPAASLQGDMLEKARLKWARTRILSERAKADIEFISQPAIALRLKIVEAGILANDFLRQNRENRIKATNEEIAAYLAEHPEYDVEKKKTKAEQVLERAKAGEDFAALAKEFSEDRATRDKGGLYTDMHENILWIEVENAVRGLKNGEIAETLIESKTGFHIVKRENKKVEKNASGGESTKFSIRHILLQKSFEEPNNKVPGIPPPFMAAEEIAKAEIEKTKRAAFIAEILTRFPISLPEDFTVDLPETVIKNAVSTVEENDSDKSKTKADN